MKRCLVLAGAGLALSTLVPGCLTEKGPPDAGDDTAAAEPENGNETETDDGEAPPSSAETENTDGGDLTEDIMIVLRNRTPTEQLVHVALATDDNTLIDADFTVAPDDHRAIDTGITETGQYDVSITVEDGPATSISFDVEDYDLGMGSNLVAEIFEDEIRLLIEQ